MKNEVENDNIERNEEIILKILLWNDNDDEENNERIMKWYEVIIVMKK